MSLPRPTRRSAASVAPGRQGCRAVVAITEMTLAEALQDDAEALRVAHALADHDPDHLELFVRQAAESSKAIRESLLRAGQQPAREPLAGVRVELKEMPSSSSNSS
ncbi:MAG TPA: hypothetical protein ENK57_02495 [Polyangiaceae bacterium]|nr:hypothetical protein [Polyangiaceae bacterium]